MITFHPLRLEAKQEMTIKEILSREGKIAAIKLYMKYTESRLWEAKMAVERLGTEIVPGPTSRAGKANY